MTNDKASLNVFVKKDSDKIRKKGKITPKNFGKEFIKKVYIKNVDEFKLIRRMFPKNFYEIIFFMKLPR